ncbi:MAG: hypothetical protein DRJ64_09765 [Thermoprotei archaeon]|nr:MAG: hypothetical protein DRJ64_09765 [Thermoprotei archaeon]
MIIGLIIVIVLILIAYGTNGAKAMLGGLVGLVVLAIAIIIILVVANAFLGDKEVQKTFAQVKPTYEKLEAKAERIYINKGIEAKGDITWYDFQ